MHHHLARLLKRRLLIPSNTSTSTSSSAAAAAFSTSRRPPYARRTNRPPENPAESHVDDAVASTAAEEAWRREKLPSELPRPPTIPFQPRVANAVRLVGTVSAPVQITRLPDGRFSAVSVLVQDRRADLPKLWIPVVFQDDLAQIAASHVKEKDLVYVSGQLTGDVPPFKLTDGQANIQVVANLLSFVDSKSVEMDVIMDEEEGFMQIVEVEKKVQQPKMNLKYPTGTVSGYKNKQHKFNTLWNELLNNPLDWTDNRAEKKNGSKSAKFPDFLNKSSKEALWLDSAPKSVLEKLDNMVFNSGYSAGANTEWSKFKTSKGSSYELKQKKEVELWRKLVDNPESWWDNRADKLSSKSPDFKHKDTGEALWISPQTPRWVIDSLPTMKARVGIKGTRTPETLLS